MSNARAEERLYIEDRSEQVVCELSISDANGQHAGPNQSTPIHLRPGDFDHSANQTRIEGEILPDTYGRSLDITLAVHDLASLRIPKIGHETWSGLAPDCAGVMVNNCLGKRFFLGIDEKVWHIADVGHEFKALNP